MKIVHELEIERSGTVRKVPLMSEIHYIISNSEDRHVRALREVPTFVSWSKRHGLSINHKICDREYTSNDNQRCVSMLSIETLPWQL